MGFGIYRDLDFKQYTGSWHLGSDQYYVIHILFSERGDRFTNCIPRTKYVRGILWFSRRYAASAFHRLRDNLKNLIGLLPYLICILI